MANRVRVAKHGFTAELQIVGDEVRLHSFSNLMWQGNTEKKLNQYAEFVVAVRLRFQELKQSIESRSSSGQDT